jgi:hypothetical protein
MNFPTFLVLLAVAAPPDLPPAIVPDNPAPTATAPDTKLLAGTFKEMLLKNMPTPLTESLNGWGNQKEAVIGVYWKKEGPLRYKPEPMKKQVNDGHWQKVRVEAIDPAKSLSLEIANMRTSPTGTTLFDATVGLDTRITYEQQMWTAGKRLYAGETRCRCRAELKLTVELDNKLEFASGSLVPNFMLRVRVTKADLQYRDFVCEHTLGVDGKPAEVMGKTVLEFVKKVKPNLEKDMLAQANAGIVKAADTKEIRIEFDKILKGQPPAVKREK